MGINRFSSTLIQQLGYYVYLYINPLDNSVFYVGKGKGNRVFEHLNDTTLSPKTETIKKIHEAGQEPRIEILVHGLHDEITALRIEAAVIDLLGVDTLTNIVRGYESNIVGRMEIHQLAAIYDSQPITIEEPAILIRINQFYRYGMRNDELYEVTRGVWKVGERRKNARYAFAVYQGIVREIYEIEQWYPAGTTVYHTRNNVHIPDRWEFEGHVVHEILRRKYIDHLVKQYLATKSQNPITYVNC